MKNQKTKMFQKMILDMEKKKKKKTRLDLLKEFRVCLFEGEIRWMKNFGEKIRMKIFLEYAWLGGEERK